MKSKNIQKFEVVALMSSQGHFMERAKWFLKYGVINKKDLNVMLTALLHSEEDKAKLDQLEVGPDITSVNWVVTGEANASAKYGCFMSEFHKRTDDQIPDFMGMVDDDSSTDVGNMAKRIYSNFGEDEAAQLFCDAMEGQMDFDLIKKAQELPNCPSWVNEQMIVLHAWEATFWNKKALQRIWKSELAGSFAKLGPQLGAMYGDHLQGLWGRLAGIVGMRHPWATKGSIVDRSTLIDDNNPFCHIHYIAPDRDAVQAKMYGYIVEGKRATEKNKQNKENKSNEKVV